MPKEEWGVKRACPKCSVRFYDLQQDPMTCPSCGATFDVSSLVEQKSRSAAPDREAKAVETKSSDDLDETVVDLEEDETVADELDDDLLDDDDDDTVALEEIADVPNEDDDS